MNKVINLDHNSFVSAQTLNNSVYPFSLIGIGSTRGLICRYFQKVLYTRNASIQNLTMVDLSRIEYDLMVITLTLYPLHHVSITLTSKLINRMADMQRENPNPPYLSK